MSQQFILHAGDPERMRILANIAEFVRKLTPAKSWTVEVKQYSKRRSNDQNEALWGLAYKILSDATGHDAEDLHTFFLGEHFGWEVKDVLGQKRKVPKRRSSKLTTAEFAEFFAFIQQRSAETVGIYIPDPDPYWRKAA